MDSSSDSNHSDDQMFRSELQIEDGDTRKSKRPIRGWMAPINLMRRFTVNGLVRGLAFIMAAICIFQLVWIQHLKAGLTRVPNDSFDNTFSAYDGIRDQSSPLIWDGDRQSFIHNALPVPVHSHNDYTRRIPLFEALGSGCISVEADVQLRNSDLEIGHTASSAHKGATLRSMYLEPLERMLKTQNTDVPDGKWRGIYNHAPQQTLVLLVDHKTAGAETFAELDAQLQPLRDLDYLTYWNGKERVDRPLTVVASGNAPFASVLALNATHRDIFWDAQLDMLLSPHDDFRGETPVYAYNQSNSYFASTEWHRARLYAWHNPNLPPPSSPGAMDRELAQIDQAKARGLISRYWDVPSEPPNLREIAWRVLVDLKVGILNMDDLGAVRARAKGWGSLVENVK